MPTSQQEAGKRNGELHPGTPKHLDQEMAVKIKGLAQHLTCKWWDHPTLPTPTILPLGNSSPEYWDVWPSLLFLKSFPSTSYSLVVRLTTKPGSNLLSNSFDWLLPGQRIQLRPILVTEHWFPNPEYFQKQQQSGRRLPLPVMARWQQTAAVTHPNYGALERKHSWLSMLSLSSF